MKKFLNLIIKNLWKLNQRYFICQKNKHNYLLPDQVSYNDIFVVHTYNITNKKKERNSNIKILLFKKINFI